MTVLVLGVVVLEIWGWCWEVHVRDDGVCVGDDGDAGVSVGDNRDVGVHVGDDGGASVSGCWG